MNCNNTNCKKYVRNYNICETCSTIYCSSSCLSEHKRDAHGNAYVNISDNPMPRYSLSKSLFLKHGIYEKEIIDDPHFDFANFEFVKSDRKKCLGQGAFGEVHLAINKIDKKQYAIKVMEKEKIIESGATIDIIHREISIHRKINHENIVKVHSHFENDKFFYLIMEYVNGGSLFSIIKKQKGIDEKKAFKYFIQACSAVNFLHMNNLIHRDLKPENILINDKEVVKLCDFGWCVDISNGNRVTFCGTYEYMAPEIVKELPYNFEIDVWSLGILLYELTHGYSPFRAEKEDGEDYHEIFTNIIKYKFKIEKDLSKGCIDLIQKLLTPDNRKRIKIREIFSHPWVIEMENEVKEEMRKLSEKTVNSNSTNASDSSRGLIKNPTQPVISNSLLNDSYNIETLKKEIKNETLRLKLESKINQNSNDVSGLLDKITSKEKTKKIQTSKEKIKKLENKLISEKIISKDSTSIEKNGLSGEKVIKKKIVRKKTEKSKIENISKIDTSNIGDKSAENKSNDCEPKKLIDEKKFNERDKIQENNGIALERINISNINLDDISKKKNSLDNEKGKMLNNISNINISDNNSFLVNKNNRHDNTNNIFHLDISGLNSKNTFNILSDNRETFEISPDNNNFDNLRQIKTSKFNTYNLNENDNLSNITNLKNLNAFNDNDNMYFDHVLDNIQKKNRDKHTKKNKNIDKLLTSVNANLVNSKIYGNLDKSGLEEKKNNEFSSNKNNLNNSNFNNLLVSSNSDLFFEFNKSPVKFDDNNFSKIEDENNILVSNKNKKNSIKEELHQIDEVVKKKIKVSKSKNKNLTNNLENENDIKYEKDDVLKNSNNKKMKISDLNKSSDGEEVYNRKLNKKEFGYEEEILSIPNYNNKKNKKSLPLSNHGLIDDLGSKFTQKAKERELNKNKTTPDLFKNRNSKDVLIHKLDKIDLDKQLNLDFLPRDLLYNDMTYDDSSKRMLESMEILEKAKIQKLKEKENNSENKEEEMGFWDKVANMLNPFKCANYGNPN